MRFFLISFLFLFLFIYLFILGNDSTSLWERRIWLHNILGTNAGIKNGPMSNRPAIKKISIRDFSAKKIS